MSNKMEALFRRLIRRFSMRASDFEKYLRRKTIFQVPLPAVCLLRSLLCSNNLWLISVVKPL